MTPLYYVATPQLRRHHGWIVFHKGTCWHIEHLMAQGKTTAVSLVVGRTCFHPCGDCRP